MVSVSASGPVSVAPVTIPVLIAHVPSVFIASVFIASSVFVASVPVAPVPVAAASIAARVPGFVRPPLVGVLIQGEPFETLQWMLPKRKATYIQFFGHCGHMGGPMKFKFSGDIEDTRPFDFTLSWKANFVHMVGPMTFKFSGDIKGKRPFDFTLATLWLKTNSDLSGSPCRPPRWGRRNPRFRRCASSRGRPPGCAPRPP